MPMWRTTGLLLTAMSMAPRGAGTGPAAKAGLTHNAGAAKDHNAEQIGNQKRSTTIGCSAVGERPNICHTHSGADGS